MSDKPTVNITSHNQSGGITAQTVNIGPGQRHMNESLGADLKKNVPTGSEVTIVAVMGDNEAMAFAEEIRKWMLANGYPNVKGVNLSMYLDPVFGQIIQKKGEGFELIIGSHPR